MRGGEEKAGGIRAVVYCVVPRDLAAKLHDPLRRHFADDPTVEIVVERRGYERRRGSERRGAEASPQAGERRAIHSQAGRRIADRRALTVAIPARELPRKARPFADRLRFLERLEPRGEQAEDVDTARLVTRIQAGDKDGFATLYLRYFDRVYRYFKVILNDPQEAEDATQHVFTRLFEALPRYELREQPFRVWLFVVVRNHALTTLQKLARFDVVDPAEISRARELVSADSADLDLSTLSWISDSDLLLFVERLPLPQRQVLLLRFMLDLSHKQIAGILGRTPEDVRGLQHRALRFLGERLTALGREPTRDSRSRMLRRVPQAPVLRFRRFVLR